MLCFTRLPRQPMDRYSAVSFNYFHSSLFQRQHSSHPMLHRRIHYYSTNRRYYYFAGHNYYYFAINNYRCYPRYYLDYLEQQQCVLRYLAPLVVTGRQNPNRFLHQLLLRCPMCSKKFHYLFVPSYRLFLRALPNLRQLVQQYLPALAMSYRQICPPTVCHHPHGYFWALLDLFLLHLSPPYPKLQELVQAQSIILSLSSTLLPFRQCGHPIYNLPQALRRYIQFERTFLKNYYNTC